MIKRKGIKRFMMVVLACVIVCTLTACTTKLNGTYTATDGVIEHSFIFKEDNKVDVSAFDVAVEGDYVIEDGQITITYSLFGLRYDFVKSFEKDGNSIFIDGIEFVKEK